MYRFTMIALMVLSSSFAMAEPEVVKPKEIKQVVLTKHNSVSLQDYFYTASITKLKQKLIKIDNSLREGEPIYLVLDTGGGSIIAGLELFDLVKGLKHEVTTITVYAASMGFHAVANLGKRYVLPNGNLMSHKAWGVAYGQFPKAEMESRRKYWDAKVLRMDEQVVSRTNGKYTLESYQKLYEYEYRCDGQQCVDDGFADEVITARCDNSLQGVKDVVEYKEYLWGAGVLLKWHEIRSKCPLNTGVMDTYFSADQLKLGVNGKLTPAELDIMVNKFKKLSNSRRDPVFKFRFTPEFK